MAIAILVLQRQGVPQARVQPRGDAARHLLAGIAFVGAVFIKSLLVGLDAGRGFQPLGLALGHHQRGTNRIAGVDGRERPVQRVDTLDGLDVDHVPARRVKAPQEVGDQVAVQVHQGTPRLQRAVAASGHVGVAVAKVALADGGAGQVDGNVFGVVDVLLAQLLRGFASGTGRQIGVQRCTHPRNLNGLQLGLSGDTLGENGKRKCGGHGQRCARKMHEKT